MYRPFFVLDAGIRLRGWSRIPKAERIESILAEFPCCCEPEPGMVIQFPRKEDQGRIGIIAEVAP